MLDFSRFMDSLLINNIYRATEGEGIFVGTPQIFVRFQGCHIGCVNCDSMETWAFDEQKRQPFSAVMDTIESLAHKSHYPLKRVSITGGDPLHPKHHEALKTLITELKLKNYWLNLEAAGTRIVDDFFDRVDFISFDLKTPSTKVKTSLALLAQMHEVYGEKMQVKAVVAHEEDFNYVEKCFDEIQERLGFHQVPWVMTPAHESHEKMPQERYQKIQWLNEERGQRFRVIGQQHKWVYGAGRMDV
jgi:7-carboxy-7-deazaguanine synthase